MGNGQSETASYAELSRLATDATPAVRAAVAVALKQYLTGNLTVTRRAGKPGSEEFKTLAALITASKAPEDALLPMNIWMALEAALSVEPVTTIEMLTRVAPDAQPLSRRPHLQSHAPPVRHTEG